MIQHIITDLCHHLEIGIDGNLDIGNKKVIVGTPAITLIGNTFTITCSTSNANIYYTLDGSTPTANSIRYTSAVTLSNNCTIKAIAIKNNKYSAIAEETYVKPITYLTQWKIVGNSEVHGNEIWSCGEYSAVDGKYHILVKPQGGSIADIALTEPLRKVNDVADTIEFPSGTDGKAVITRNLNSELLSNLSWYPSDTSVQNKYRMTSRTLQTIIKPPALDNNSANILSPMYETKPILGGSGLYNTETGIGVSISGNISVYDENYNQENSISAFNTHIDGVEIIFALATPTTELVDAPQIEEADSYTCEISQGGKAVSWSSFTTNPS